MRETARLFGKPDDSRKLLTHWFMLNYIFDQGDELCFQYVNGKNEGRQRGNGNFKMFCTRSSTNQIVTKKTLA